ncbi:Septation ring formation regulator EzrA like [Actinidia chinensis var. chinensis]|uniref:Septation ring formation regulator EzrA like n=1 Tax=Actinidia chinensis var. chinensis TaxID=1590841 RepID=A0A2R6RUP9_ACTCC|nr:Septation ring formation regulator EzrA like [Actinidia chinensis var. chinensis]
MSGSHGEYQSSGMLSRAQLLHLFDRFSLLTSQPEVKKRIADAVDDKQEAVAVTTAIQEEIFLEMGVDPSFGLACLGKVNMAYENDQDLMICFYRFVVKEEMACEEAELGPDKFAEKMQMQHKLQEQQLEMLKHLRKFHLDDQSAILEKLRQQMEAANFDSEASVFSADQIQDMVRRRVTPVFRPR